MVSYWMTKELVEAKAVKAPEGHYVMWMEGEKYPFPGFPRGSLLFGQLSKLKHDIKNKIFNTVWAMLEEKKPTAEIRSYLKGAWQEIFDLFDKNRYDAVPFENLVPPIKEFWRVMTDLEPMHPDIRKFKEIAAFIFQEDDAYRMRFQWMTKFLPKWFKPLPEDFDYALAQLEHGEVIGDMKERERLFRRIFMFMAQDSTAFREFLRRVNWSKMGLSDGDKYFFRAKYFKVDWPEYEY